MKDTLHLSERLLELCKKGDERARFTLYKQYVQAMYNSAYRILGNQFDAEDVVQDAFVKAFKKIESLKEVKAFGSWLKQIVVNESISLIRKQKRLIIPVESPGELPEKEDENEEIDFPMDKVMAAIMELPEGARVVFTLRVIEDYKFKDIAQITGQTINNCKVQFHRSRKLLNSKLKTTLYAE